MLKLNKQKTTRQITIELIKKLTNIKQKPKNKKHRNKKSLINSIKQTLEANLEDKKIFEE